MALDSEVQSIKNLLDRIAHTLEHMAKHQDPNFEPLIDMRRRLDIEKKEKEKNNLNSRPNPGLMR